MTKNAAQHVAGVLQGGIEWHVRLCPSSGVAANQRKIVLYLFYRQEACLTRGNGKILAALPWAPYIAFMPIVLTKCPETDKTVSAVHRMKSAEFEALNGPRAFRCSLCQQVHSWTKDSAWLEGAEH